MAYRLRGENESGDPVEILIEFCWRCGVPVNLMLVDMAEHVDRAHPVTGAAAPDTPRHALDE